MKQPMDRRELEALVDKAHDAWLDGKAGMGVARIITDALWGAMVETHRSWGASDAIEANDRAAYCFSHTGPARRILICTDEPAPAPEADGVKLARMVKCGLENTDTVRVLVERILMEADDE